MKLIFYKDEHNEIDVKLQNGTIIEDFSYTEMVAQLLSNNNFSDTVFTGLSDDEQRRLESMLERISDVFKTPEEEC